MCMYERVYEGCLGSSQLRNHFRYIDNGWSFLDSPHILLLGYLLYTLSNKLEASFSETIFKKWLTNILL